MARVSKIFDTRSRWTSIVSHLLSILANTMVRIDGLWKSLSS